MPAELREALDAAITQAETQSANQPEGGNNEHSAQPENDEAAGQEAPEPRTDIEGEGSDDGAGKPAGDDSGKAKKPTDGAGADADRKADDEQARVKEHRVDRPPSTWKKEAKGEWATLPLGVRQEVYRREQQINQVLSETAPIREAVDQFNQVVSPYMARIQQHNVTPIQAINSLLATDHQLATSHPRDAAQLMAKLISNYNIDIGALDEALAALKGGRPAQQSQQPDLVAQIRQSLMQELTPVLDTVKTFQQQQLETQQAAQAEVAQTVEQMALNPEFPYFDDVRDLMADLMEVSARRGVYISLEDAYAKAVAIDPNTSGQVNQQQQRNIANNAHQRALAAKNAASSVPSNPGYAGGTVPNNDGSLRGAIESAFGGGRI